MALEVDPEEVERLPLRPGGTGPERGRRFDRGIRGRDGRVDAKGRLVARGMQPVDHLEANVLGAGAPIDHGQIDESPGRGLALGSEAGEERLRVDPRHRDAKLVARGGRLRHLDFEIPVAGADRVRLHPAHDRAPSSRSISGTRPCTVA